MAVGAFRVTVDQTYDSWFDDDDPALIALDRFRAQFGSDDGVFLVYRAKDGNVFSYESLRRIRDLQEQLDAASRDDDSALSHITRLQGLSNARVQINEGDTLRSARLVPDPLRNDPTELAFVESTARAQTSFPLFYFSENGEYGALMIQTDFGAIPIEGSQAVLGDALSFDGFDSDFSSDAFGNGSFGSATFDDDIFVVDESAQTLERQFRDTDFYEYLDFMVALRGVIMQPEFTDHFEYYPVGTAAMMDLTADTMVQMGMLFMLMIVIVVALLWLLLHSASAVVWPVLAIGLCTLWVIGFCGWFGIALSQMLGLTATLILAVGVADCVHVMSTYLYYRRHDLDHVQALDKAYLKTGLPILLTTITTMAGMLALATNPLVQFRVFGFASAAGVFLALVFTLVVLPVLMDLWHPKEVHTDIRTQPKQARRWTWWLSLPLRIVTWPIRRILAIRIVRYVTRAHWLQPTL
ncbi:MAG: MMPL family transporter [Natronospirillum sp.]